VVRMQGTHKQNLRNVFFPSGVKLIYYYYYYYYYYYKLVFLDKFLYCLGPYDFVVVTDDGTTVNIDPCSI